MAIAVIGGIAAGVANGVLEADGPARPTRVNAPLFDVSQSSSLLNQYRVTCHSSRLQTGGLVLEAADLTAIAEHSDIWEKVVRKLRAGAMPPAGVRRPDAASYDGLAASLEAALDRAAGAHPNPGRRAASAEPRRVRQRHPRSAGARRRRRRRCCRPTIRATASTTSPTCSGFRPCCSSATVGAAGRISALAVGDPRSHRRLRDVTRVRQDSVAGPAHRGPAARHRRRHGRPPYVPAGRRVRSSASALCGPTWTRRAGSSTRTSSRSRSTASACFIAPVGGEPTSAILDDNASTRGLSKSTIDARLKVRVPVTAGPHDGRRRLPAASARAEHAGSCSPTAARSTRTTRPGVPHIRHAERHGAVQPTGPGDTPSRRRIFICRPATPADEPACATRDHLDARAPRLPSAGQRRGYRSV